MVGYRADILIIVLKTILAHLLFFVLCSFLFIYSFYIPGCCGTLQVAPDGSLLIEILLPYSLMF